jgi:hypothetical protein
MREVGCALPKKAEVVANFIYGLNEEHFSELKIQLSNAAHFNLTLPADLSAAYALAGNFYSSHSHSRSNPDRTVMNLNSKQGKVKKKVNRNHSSKNSSSNSNSGSALTTTPSPLSAPPSAPSPSGKPKVICSYCNKPNHTEEKCSKKARDKGAGAKVENHLLDADPVDIPELGSDLEFDVFTLQSIECNSLNSNSSRVVLLDTGAQASVSNDLSLLENVHSTDLAINSNCKAWNNFESPRFTKGFYQRR